jgi:APA family basic amino acid/polyamine antiporter
MVGTGVFTTSGFLLKDLGSPWLVLLAWLAGGVIAALGALSYGALARRIPESGGEFIFLSRTIHPAAGFVAGWISLLVGFSAPLAAVAFGFGSYLAPWLPGVDPKLTGTVALAGFAVVHAVGVRFGSRAQDAIVAVKLLLILGFIWGGITRIQAIPPTSTPAAGLGAFLASLVWISFSYSGWNAAIYVGGEVRDPERNLPRALLLGTGLVTALYLALNAVFVFAAPVAELANKPEIGQVAARALGGEAWAHAITTLVALGLLTSVSSLIMAGPRVSAQMARDRCLPRWLDTAGGPPRMAIVLQSALALLMLWSSTFENLLTVVGFTLSLCTAATVLGLIRLRLREGPRFPVPGWPWVPGLFLLGVLIMAVLAVIERTWPAIQKLLGGS